MIKVKRIYDDYSKEDGFRLLVDRLWPRGISKERAHLDLWLKDIAPTTELRQWFGHEPPKWAEFQKRYTEELKSNPALDALRILLKRENTITLLYGARDIEHNEAIVIRNYLQHLPIQSA